MITANTSIMYFNGYNMKHRKYTRSERVGGKRAENKREEWGSLTPMVSMMTPVTRDMPG
jgi:hypothetical protein